MRNFLIVTAMLFATLTVAQAGTPVWTFEALTATTISLPENESAVIQYKVTNQSYRTHTLVLKSIPGVTQITTGFGVCANSFVLTAKASCVLSLKITGSQIPNTISEGPIVCQHGSNNQCYQPARADILRITKTSPNLQATITLTGSPLTLIANGLSGTLTVNNASLYITATNVLSDFSGTSLQGNVTETGNTCATIAPGGSCTLMFTPGTTVVTQTNFTIKGTNTNVAQGAIAIEAAVSLNAVSPNTGASSGATAVTLTGVSLTGATSVTFDGIPATSLNVINSTTVTAVTPAHAAGAVDVALTTPTGSSTLSSAYTYTTTAVGDPLGGGIVACLGGGTQNLIAATSDSSNQGWGSQTITTGATSDTDGAANTLLIVNNPNEPVPNASTACASYQVDSQNHSPCDVGNTCYNNWFLPAKDQLNCLYINKTAIGGFSAVTYWTSTEDTNPALAWQQYFLNGFQAPGGKTLVAQVRCVRAFTP